MKNITFCLDNAKICKCKYLLAWADHLVNQGHFSNIQFFYLVVGHTKFEPDRLFSSIARTFYVRYVFCIEMPQTIALLYSSCQIFTSKKIFQWWSALEEKYTALTGINSFHDLIIAKGSPLVALKVKGQCYKGLYEVATIRKPDFDKTSNFWLVSYESNAPSLTDQSYSSLKNNVIITSRQIRYCRIHKVSILGSIRNCKSCSFSTFCKQNQTVYDGSGHIQPGKICGTMLLSFCKEKEIISRL